MVVDRNPENLLVSSEMILFLAHLGTVHLSIVLSASEVLVGNLEDYFGLVGGIRPQNDQLIHS